MYDEYLKATEITTILGAAHLMHSSFSFNQPTIVEFVCQLDNVLLCFLIKYGNSCLYLI
jgi:hypothetical protein